MNNKLYLKQERLKKRSRNQGKGEPKYLFIIKKSKYMKRWLLRNPWIKPLCVFNYAAIKIQALARGFIIRQRKKFQLPLRTPLKSRKKSSIPLNKKISSKQLDRYLAYLDHSRRLEKEKNNVYVPPSWLNGGFSAWSAVRIQSWWRMVASNRRLFQRRRLVNQVAAIVIQTTWRNYHYSIPLPEEIPEKKPKITDPFLAAYSIQHAWRRYCNRRIYFYFRNLILFKLQGAPAELLRTIIPNETDLLDRASGVHVKFRLGGKIFPPKIYFKIFTHRPLCDVNAFAPRDYIAEKPANELYYHNKSTIIEKYNKIQYNNAASKRGNIRIGVKYFNTIIHTTNPNGLANWYQRDDQNNWRPIASFLIEKVETPPWFQESNKLPTLKNHHYYHFDKNIRKTDLQTYRRRRKKEWMMKMYKMHLQQNENDIDDYEDRREERQEEREEEIGGLREERRDRVKLPPLVNSDGKPYSSKSFDSGWKGEKSIVSADTEEGASFIERLEYKSQIFYDVKSQMRRKEGVRMAEMINLETKEKLPFLAPAKGKYSISADEEADQKALVLNDSVSSNYLGEAGYTKKRPKSKEQRERQQRQGIGFPQPNHDELLEWSLQLDYDNYVKDWNLIGTSLPSDMVPRTIY